MEILKELEEDKARLAEMLKEGIEEETPEEDVVEEKTEEVVEEEPEVKEEPKPEVKEELDDAGHARLRRERAAEKKRADELEAENQRLRNPPKEDDGEEVNPIIAKVYNRIQYEEAGREFASREEQFKQNAPADFEDVANQYKAAVYHKIRIDNPDLSHADLLEATNKDLLMKASNYLNEGFNPIEEMYHAAKKLGFKAIPKEEPKPEPEEKKDLKPDLSKVAANRARNAGTAGAAASGSGGGQLTAAVAADMPAKDWAKLSPEQKKAVFNTLR